MSQHIVLLTFFFVPSHQFSIHFVHEQTFQTWYYRKIPHHLGRRIISTSPGSSRGILYRHALHIRHESKFSYSPQYRMQSLGQACTFCASNPKGQTIFFASYVVSGKVLLSGSMFFISFSSSSNPLSDKPFDVFHCNNSNVVPNFF